MYQKDGRTGRHFRKISLSETFPPDFQYSATNISPVCVVNMFIELPSFNAHLHVTFRFHVNTDRQEEEAVSIFILQFSV